MKFGRFRGIMIAVSLASVGLWLFMPWTSHCDPAMRDMQCQSNIRQLGLGILAYTSQNGSFPPGTVPNDALPPGRRLGWGFAILPYIDMQGFFDDREIAPEDVIGLANDDPEFLEVRTSPGITKCPSAIESPSEIFGRAYVAIAGLGVDATGLTTSDKRAGVFGYGRRVTFADLKDGASNTMMLAESSTPAGFWFAGGPGRVRGLDPARTPYIGKGRQFGGIHSRGTTVLMADGSTRFVRDSVEPKVFEALSTIAGGEKVSGLEDE